MSSEAAIELSARASGRVAGHHRRSRFFVGMSGVLLLLVVAAFVPTLHVRAFFQLRPMPLYLYLHGGVLTAWFVFLFVQASLASRGHIDLHRRMGTGGALLAVLVVGASLVAQVGKAPRLRAAGIDTALRVGSDAAVFWGNLASLLLFISLVVTAILLRRRPEAHKRLMLLASIGIMGPALARFSRWPLFGGSAFEVFGPLERYFSSGGILVLLIAVIVYDLVARRRLHPATVVGTACIVLARILAAMLAWSESGRALIGRWL